MQLASEIEQIEPRFAPSPWPGHEHVRGLAVMAPPLSSGHVLGLRVWPENDFAPHVSVWHRAPWGNWSMFSDGPLLEATCQRYWGSAVRESRLARPPFLDRSKRVACRDGGSECRERLPAALELEAGPAAPDARRASRSTGWVGGRNGNREEPETSIPGLWLRRWITAYTCRSRP